MLPLLREHWLVATAVALMALYLATRLWFISRFPYFSDEGIYATFANLGAHSLDKLFVSLIIGREPLFTWLAIPWIKLGFNPLTAVRLVSVISGLLTVGIVALIARRIADTVTAVFAAALCVVLPFFVVHDGIGIYEPLVTLIMAGALYVQLDLAQRPRLAAGALLGLVLGLGILTKENTEPAIALVPVSLLWFDWGRSGCRHRLVTWLGAIAITASAIVGAEFILRSSHYYPNYQNAHAIGFVKARTLHQVLADPFGPTTRQAWWVVRPALLGYVTIPLLIAAALGAAQVWRRNGRLALLLVVWVLFPFAVALLFTTFPFPRHVMYVLPPAIVLMASALVRSGRFLSGVVPTRLRMATCAVAGGLVLAPAGLFDGSVLAHPRTARYPGLDEWQYVTGYPSGGVWPAVADTIRRVVTGPHVVVLTPLGSPMILGFLMQSSPRYHFIWSIQPAAPSAQLILREVVPPFPDPKTDAIMAHGHFVLVRQFQRPNHGTAVRLYQRAPA